MHILNVSTVARMELAKHGLRCFNDMVGIVGDVADEEVDLSDGDA
jgi:hypothetical protein